jgi:hypothetical protein
MTKPKFSDWLNHWWQKFDAMEVGTAYEAAKCAKDPELFTEVCKDYIDRAENGNCYEFSEDYKFFKKFTPAKTDLLMGEKYGYIKPKKK